MLHWARGCALPGLLAAEHPGLLLLIGLAIPLLVVGLLVWAYVKRRRRPAEFVCPACTRLVPAEAQCCPHCGHAMDQDVWPEGFPAALDTAVSGEGDPPDDRAGRGDDSGND
jgi:hypothetical protein